MQAKLTMIFFLIFLATNAYAFETDVPEEKTYTMQSFARKKFGLGVVVGDPTGITGKYMLDNKSGIAATIAWETSGDSEFYISSDYLFHFNDLIKIPDGVVPLYFGGGLRYIDRENRDNKFGIRIPVGIEYLFWNYSLGAFAEIVPVLDLAPDTEFDAEFGVGIRFFF